MKCIRNALEVFVPYFLTDISVCYCVLHRFDVVQAIFWKLFQIDEVQNPYFFTTICTN